MVRQNDDRFDRKWMAHSCVAKRGAQEIYLFDEKL